MTKRSIKTTGDVERLLEKYDKQIQLKEKQEANLQKTKDCPTVNALYKHAIGEVLLSQEMLNHTTLCKYCSHILERSKVSAASNIVLEGENTNRENKPLS